MLKKEKKLSILKSGIEEYDTQIKTIEKTLSLSTNYASLSKEDSNNQMLSILTSVAKEQDLDIDDFGINILSEDIKKRFRKKSNTLYNRKRFS